MVKPVIIFLSEMTLTQTVNFPTWIAGCDFYNLALFDLFISSASFC